MEARGGTFTTPRCALEHLYPERHLAFTVICCTGSDNMFASKRESRCLGMGVGVPVF